MTVWLAASLLDELGLNFKVLGVQVAIFLTTFVVLSRFLFGRVLGHLQRREQEIRESEESIARERSSAEEMSRQYRAHLVRIDKEAYERMQDVYRETLVATGKTVAAAQGEARRQVEKARIEIAKEKSQASSQLRSEVARLTFDAVERALETRLDPQTHRAVVEAFLAGKAQP